MAPGRRTFRNSLPVDRAPEQQRADRRDDRGDHPQGRADHPGDREHEPDDGHERRAAADLDEAVGTLLADPPGRALSAALEIAHVVLTMSTEQSALWLTVFGTLPSTLRDMPLLPITSTSAPCLPARSTSTLDASPSLASQVASRPCSRASSTASRRAGSTSSAGLICHWTSSGASRDSRLSRSSETGLYALRNTILAS